MVIRFTLCPLKVHTRGILIDLTALSSSLLGFQKHVTTKNVTCKMGK